MNEKQTESAVERELSTFQKTELAAKLAAACIPLTYISGYLIVTSYLGTYGLALNSGDLFRAKYIYVGFEYLMFMTLVAAAFSIIARAIELAALIIREYKSTSKTNKRQIQEERKRAQKMLSMRSDTQNSLVEKFRKLRGDFVVGLIILIFALEIIFLNPENLGGILPRQILYLISVAIYQLTYYRELYEPYQWGFVFGRRWVEDLRWSLLFSQAFAAGGILCKVAWNVMKAHDVTGLWMPATEGLGLGFVLIAVEINVLGGFSIFARSKRLCELDKDKAFDPQVMTNPTDFGKTILKSFFTGRSLRGIAVAYFKIIGNSNWFQRLWFWLMRALTLAIPFGIMLLYIRHRDEFNSWNRLDSIWIGASLRVWIKLALEIAPLLLSLLVLGNVSLLTSMSSIRARRLKQEGGSDEPDDQAEAAGKNGPHERFVQYTRRAILAATLYVASVLGFGYIVYPFIPVQKSGGNYSVKEAPRVCVRLVTQTTFLSCPEDILPQLKANEALVPLEEDSDSIYLASDKDEGGPAAWRWGNVNKYMRPRVYAVSRKCIAGVVDALPNSFATRCATLKVP